MLSTPPAFILSQDQTLMFKKLKLLSLIGQSKLACCSFRKSEFTVFKGSLKFQRSSHLLCRYRIISYELCSFLNLSRFIHCSVIKVPTSLLPELYKLLRNFYHCRDLLSFPRQLIYIIISFIVCQQLFYLLVSFRHFIAFQISNSFILSQAF